jgi:hypothetical protein
LEAASYVGGNDPSLSWYETAEKTKTLEAGNPMFGPALKRSRLQSQRRKNLQ